MILKEQHDRQSLWIIRGVLALGAFFLVIWKFGFQILDPTHDSWLYYLDSDIVADYFAWLYYRDTPWQFPLGVIENYSYPVKTSIGLTGGIPLLAVPFKALSPLLPETFQYYGWWFLMNYILQGWAGVFFMRVLKIKNNWLLLLGGALFILSPPFLDRHPHANLTAHWVLLYSLATALASSTQIGPKHKIGIYAALTFAATWIHPYLVLFPLGFAMADWVKSWWFEKSHGHKVLSLRQTIVWPLAVLLALITAYYLIGYHIMPTKGAVSSGFGLFSSNLNTFFNSMDRMAIIPGIPLAFPEQYEGFCYLGAGMIGLLMAGFMLLVWKRPYVAPATWVRMWPVAILVLGFFVLALSNVVTLNDYVLFEVPFNKVLRKLGGVFRSSGRYIWAPHYLIYGLVFWVLVKRIPSKEMLIPAFAIALLIQFIDVKPYIPSRDIYPHGPYETPLKSEAWRPVFEEARLIAMVPAYSRHFATYSDYMYPVRLAYESKTPITAGHLARYDNEARNRMRDSISTVQESGQLSPNFEEVVFVSAPSEAHRFIKPIQSGALKAYLVDGYTLYIPEAIAARNADILSMLQPLVGRYDDPVDFFERNRNHWVFVSVKDEATYQLCDRVKTYVSEHGGSIDKLEFRMPYIAMWHKGEVLWDSAYTTLGPVSQSLGDIVSDAGASVIITSGGGDQRASQLIVDEKDYSLNERGINVIAVDSAFNIVERAWYDTYDQCGKWAVE